MPLHLLDHSGLRISARTNFKEYYMGFDSGQVGFIFTTKKAIRSAYSVKYVTKKVLERAYKELLAEVETYDQYLSGDVWGYTVTGNDGEEKDSLWGCFGLDYCKKLATEAARGASEPEPNEGVR